MSMFQWTFYKRIYQINLDNFSKVSKKKFDSSFEISNKKSHHDYLQWIKIDVIFSVWPVWHYFPSHANSSSQIFLKEKVLFYFWTHFNRTYLFANVSCPHLSMTLETKFRATDFSQIYINREGVFFSIL